MDHREKRNDKRPAPADATTARSGDFSQDPAFDPDQLFEVVGHADSADRVAEAMRMFLKHGELARFEQAIAVFVRSARARQEPIERVLAVLIELAAAKEGVAYPHDWTLTDLRWVVLRGVLLAFYGDTSLAKRDSGIERRSGDERRHDGTRPQNGERREVL